MKPVSSATPHTFHVKNMVCNRCIRVVKEEMERLGLEVRSVHLGEVTVEWPHSTVTVNEIDAVLRRNGFELIEDRNARLIEHLKLAVLDLVRSDPEDPSRRLKFSSYFPQKLGVEYKTLSVLFSSVENVTIERYVILQKIEYVKELLKYGELTLSEIAYKLGYSSVQHLSAQFKQVSGLTPSEFKQLRTSMRIPIDLIGRRRRSPRAR